MTKTYLMEVIDPRGVLRVDMVGDIAMGLPWDEPMGPGGKADVGVSWRQGTSQELHSSCLTGCCPPVGGNWKIRVSTCVLAVEGGDIRPGEDPGVFIL